MGQWDDSQNPRDNGAPVADASGQPSWLPPGATLNPDGSVTMPNGTVVPGPGEGYTRDPQTGVITRNPGAPGVPALTGPGAPAAPTPPNVNPGPTPPPPAPPPGGGPDIFNAPLTKMYGGQFQAPAPVNIGGPTGVGATPVFTPPTFTPPPAFKFNAPSAEEALNDPGYQFRVKEGNNRLQNWAAARGTLNDSSTAKALTNYGQEAASQEYGNVWNRDWQQQTGEYNTNYKTQYQDPYSVQFGNAALQNQNNVLGYTTNAAQAAHSNDINYLNSWNEFVNKKNEFYDWQNSVFDKQFKVATA